MGHSFKMHVRHHRTDTGTLQRPRGMSAPPIFIPEHVGEHYLKANKHGSPVSISEESVLLLVVSRR